MRVWIIFFILLVLFMSVIGVNAQDGLTVTIPDDNNIPPVEWNPDNWILIITVGFVLALTVLGGVVVFFGNKLYLSAPTWVQPGIEDIARTGVVEAISTGQAIVLRTPTPLDDHALKIVEQRLNEMLNKIFEEKG